MRSFRIAVFLALFMRPEFLPGDSQNVVDSATCHRISEALAAKVSALYVYPDMGVKIAAFIRERDKTGAYTAASDSRALTQKLTADLQSVNNARHLRVFYSSSPPGRIGQPNLQNFGYEKPQQLPGNVGYLEVRGFLPREAVQQTVAAAMTSLAGTDALIIDVRRNGGGDPTGVALLCSYLFGDKPVHLNDLYWRAGDRTDQFWTDPKIPGSRYGVERPVYLLTSRFTFSAAEEFAYDLQQQKRVTIVGEVTGGGAHPGDVQPLGDNYAVFIPTGRAINPVSKKDWEGTGVIPEIQTPAADALRAAQTAALRVLMAKAADPKRKSSLGNALSELQK